jgi:hypothetical protein
MNRRAAASGRRKELREDARLGCALSRAVARFFAGRQRGKTRHEPTATTLTMMLILAEKRGSRKANRPDCSGGGGDDDGVLLRAGRSVADERENRCESKQSVLHVWRVTVKSFVLPADPTKSARKAFFSL